MRLKWGIGGVLKKIFFGAAIVYCIQASRYKYIKTPGNQRVTGRIPSFYKKELGEKRLTPFISPPYNNIITEI